MDLLQAARRGDLEALRQAGPQLLEELEAYPYFVWAAASESDQVEVLDLCLEAGLDPNGTPESRPLIHAINAKADRCVQRLLEAGADLNLQDEDGRSPLLIGIMRGDLDLVRAALSAGASPFEENAAFFLESGLPEIKRMIQDARKQAKERFAPHLRAIKKVKLGEDVSDLSKEQISLPIPFEKGATLLHLAARRNQAAAVRSLLSSGVDIDVRDQTPHERKYGRGTTLEMDTAFGGRTPLMVASESGAAEVVRLLIEHGADLEASDRFGNTALHLACGTSKPQVVNLLLAAGANPNAKTVEGGTPLLITGYFGTREIAAALLQAGASVHEPDDEGFTPILAACWEGRTEVAELLLEAGGRLDTNVEDEGDVWDALNIGKRTKTLKHLLPHLEVNPADRSESPLASAAQWHHVEAIPILIEAGARPKPGEQIRVVDGYGVKAKDMIRAVQALQSIGQAVDDQDLLSAVWQGDREFIRVLVYAGANPNSALGQAPDADVVDLLLDLGADPNQPDAEGRTPLYKAVEQYRVEVVRRLLDRGADPQIPDHEGIRPIDLAQLGDRDMRRCFKGLDPDAAKVGTLRLAAMFSDYTPPSTKDVEDALLKGADPNATVGRGVPLLAAAAAWRQWDAADLLAVFGATSTWETEVFLKIRDLPAQAGLDFAADIALLEGELGEPRTDVEGGFGAVSFTLSSLIQTREAEKVAAGESATIANLVTGREVADEIADRFRGQIKTSWCGAWRCHPVANPRLLVVPTKDPYVVVALIQPRAGEHEIGVFEILQFLRKHEHLGWSLVGIGYDTIDLQFERLPENIQDWACELAEFCPDLIDQGFGSHNELIAHLRKTRRLHFWWD